MSWLMGYMEGKNPEFAKAAFIVRIIILLLFIGVYFFWK